jgi:hypothetical protein
VSEFNHDYLNIYGKAIPVHGSGKWKEISYCQLPDSVQQEGRYFQTHTGQPFPTASDLNRQRSYTIFTLLNKRKKQVKILERGFNLT